MVRRFSPFARRLAVAGLAISFSLAAHAVDPRADSKENPAPVLSRQQATDASDKANSAKQDNAAPAKAHPGAKRDEIHPQGDLTTPEGKTNAPVADKPLTGAAKDAAIQAADAIGAFNADHVQGVAKPWQIYYQKPATPIMDRLEKLHNFVMVIITLIVLLVMGLMGYVMVKFRRSAHPVPQRFTHNKTVEIVWTVIPILILVAIGIPSVRMHYKWYFNEQALTAPDMTLKVVGHQWYWSYEYPDYGIAYDSNIKAVKDLLPGEPRLLGVDNPVVVPVNKVVRVQMTGADVIHDWAVPSFGVKKDAIPGRLNETWFKAERTGIFYGQCSELCGKSHGFMPIMVVVVSQDDFNTWVKGAKAKYAGSDAMQFAMLK